MKTIHALLLFTAVAVVCDAQDQAAPKNELAFGLGGLPAYSRSNLPKLDLGPGIGLQVNYGRRFFSARRVALYGEVDFLASPLRNVSSSVTSATRDIATLYITPGVRMKIFPTSRVSPYLAVGGGYADYQQSTFQLDGQINPASRQLSRGTFDLGGGFDVRVWRWIALRGEARDFFSGSP